VSVKALCFKAVSSVYPFVHVFILSDIVTTMSHEWLDNLEKTDGEYSPAATHDLIRFWRSKVKVTAGS